MKIFISHSSENVKEAQIVCRMLEEKGYGCFIAPRDIRPGFEYAEEIANGIDSSDVMLLLLSKQANESPHVLREIERAVSKKIHIIVYEMEKVDLCKSLEYFLMAHQWANTSPNEGYGKILESIEQIEKGHQSIVVSDKKVQEKRLKGKAGKLIIAGATVAVAAGIVVAIFTAGKGTLPFENNEDIVKEESVKKESQTKVKMGDTIVFGKYNDEPVKWRVIKLQEENNAVLIADNILTMKAFDAAESGKYNELDGEDYWTATKEQIHILGEDGQRKIRGDNRWSTSNIRTWLNSSNENVGYQDQAPGIKAMSNRQNGYEAEAGFLHGFTEAELSAIVPTKVQTGDVMTEDKVFLLSEDELQWLADADVAKYAVPTQAAAKQDQTDMYKNYSLDLGVDDYCWWLRSASGSVGDVMAYEGCIVGSSYYEGKLIKAIVGVEGYGIRPAITVNLSSVAIEKE